MSQHRKMIALCGVLVCVGGGSLLAWWLWQGPHELGRVEAEYPWQKATVSVEGEECSVEYCKFGHGVSIETKPYWKQEASTPEEAAAAQLTCLRTGGKAEDYLRLYWKPDEARDSLVATYGSMKEFVKANREIRQAVLLGTVKYGDLSIVAVKVSATDDADGWATAGLCYAKHNGRYYAMEKPHTQMMKWLSQNDYLLTQDGESK